MNVRTICLAILFCGDQSGYDIRKASTSGHYGFFVDASFGSIYPALNRMEEEGLVTVRLENQNGKPSRKVYSITEKGREAFVLELLQPHRADIFRSEFLLISIFSHLIGPKAMQTAIDRQIEFYEEELAIINAIEEQDDEGNQQPLDAITPEIEGAMKAGMWARDYGRTCVQASIDYLKEHGVELVEIARGGMPPREEDLASLKAV